MRETLINIVKYRLKMGITKENIIIGMVHTISKTLDLSLPQIINTLKSYQSPVMTTPIYSDTHNIFKDQFNKGEFTPVSQEDDDNLIDCFVEISKR